VEVGERALELHQRAVGARDVARAAGADAELGGGILHCGDHLGVLAHAEIIVRAPDGDFALVVSRIPEDGAGETPRNALEVGENAVALFLPQGVDGVLEKPAIVHCPTLVVQATRLLANPPVER
jgi:hypothetical protein